MPKKSSAAASKKPKAAVARRLKRASRLPNRRD
jgi:hypothetical protein